MNAKRRHRRRRRAERSGVWVRYVRAVLAEGPLLGERETIPFYHSLIYAEPTEPAPPKKPCGSERKRLMREERRARKRAAH